MAMRMREWAMGTAMVLGIGAMAAPAAAQVHDYEFTDGLTDSVAGGTALTPSVSPGNPSATYAVTGGNYMFDSGAGLFLGSQLPGSVYTIALRVAFDDVDGYRKLVTFNDIGTDLGLYDLNGTLDLFNVAQGSVTTDFAPGQFVDVQVSRDATGTVRGFVNGVERLNYNDSGNVFTAATGLWFLRDDTGQNREQSAGRADYIRIYDTATIPTGVPEPASWALMIAGFGAVGHALRRRPRAAPAHA